MFIGNVLALLIVPRAADRFGRKWIVLISSILNAGAYAGIMFAANIYLFYFSALLSGFAFVGRYILATVYLMELIPTKNRTFVISLEFLVRAVVGL